MDGVLVEAKEWHYDAFNQALELFGYKISPEEHLTTYDGLPTSKKLKILSKEAGLPIQLHSFINKMKQIYTMQIIHAQCKPCFIQQYALSKLKNMNYKLAVASNSIRETVEVMMQKTQLLCYLDYILSASDITYPKPHPEIYLKSIEALGLTPKECLIVEDNENGIKAAIASGAHVLTVKNVSDVNLENILNKIRLVKSSIKNKEISYS